MGIVTRFNLETFAHCPLMYSVEGICINESVSASIDAFVDLGKHVSYDPKAAQIIFLGVEASSNTRVAAAEFEYKSSAHLPTRKANAAIPLLNEVLGRAYVVRSLVRNILGASLDLSETDI